MLKEVLSALPLIINLIFLFLFTSVSIIIIWFCKLVGRYSSLSFECGENLDSACLKGIIVLHVIRVIQSWSQISMETSQLVALQNKIRVMKSGLTIAYLFSHFSYHLEIAPFSPLNILSPLILLLPTVQVYTYRVRSPSSTICGGMNPWSEFSREIRS